MAGIFSLISVAVYGFTAISINAIYAIAGLLAATSRAADWLVREFRETA